MVTTDGAAKAATLSGVQPYIDMKRNVSKNRNAIQDALAELQGYIALDQERASALLRRIQLQLDGIFDRPSVLRPVADGLPASP